MVKLGEAGHTVCSCSPSDLCATTSKSLFDIDILFRDFAAERGMKLYRAESLNGSPTFAKAVADSCAGA